MERENIEYDENKVIRNKDTGEIQWIITDDMKKQEDVLSKLPDNKRMVIEKAKNSRGSSINNKSATSYMSQPNVQEFNRQMQKRVFNSTGVGRPYAFKSVEQLEKDVSEFFDVCNNTQTVPTITSLALWLNVGKNTIYDHANNPNSPFSTILKNVITYCHSIMQNGTVDGKINPVTYIFISKNDYSMRDDKNITVTPVQDTPLNTQSTMDAIQKQLEEETTSNADYKENWFKNRCRLSFSNFRRPMSTFTLKMRISDSIF